MCNGENAVTGRVGSSEPVVEVDCFKGINRARNIIGEACKRWDNRLVLERDAYSKEYCRGRMAFLVCFKFSISNAETVGIIRKVRQSVSQENIPVLILKADVGEPHYLECWDEQLMLVRNIHIVEGPQGAIPSRVGLYYINNEISQRNSALVVEKPLLFESAIYGAYKFMPFITNWKAGEFVGLPGNFVKDLVIEQVERTSQIMQCVSNNKSSSGSGEVFGDSDSNSIAPLLFLDANGVKIRSQKTGKELIEIADVLHGPLNF
jgi:hypothetical protein